MRERAAQLCSQLIALGQACSRLSAPSPLLLLLLPCPPLRFLSLFSLLSSLFSLSVSPALASCTRRRALTGRARAQTRRFNRPKLKRAERSGSIQRFDGEVTPPPSVLTGHVSSLLPY